MNIPDEAVEAAGEALIYHQRRDITACMCGWSGWGRSHAAHQARIALEASTPHLMAIAWEEGFDRGFYDPLAGGDRDASESAAVNPYRDAGAGE